MAQTMQVCDCWVKLNEFGSDVFKRDVTPSELQALSDMHRGNVKNHPIHTVTNIRTIERTPLQEVSRLRKIYKKDLVDTMFPGKNPQCPATFKDANFNDDGTPIVEAREDEETAPLKVVPAPSTSPLQSGKTQLQKLAVTDGLK